MISFGKPPIPLSRWGLILTVKNSSEELSILTVISQSPARYTQPG